MKSIFFQLLKQLSTIKSLCVYTVGGETSDSGSFLQHQGPMGDSQILAETHEENRTWTVR